MRKTKSIGIILSLALGLSFAACKKDEEKKAEPAKESAPAATGTEGETPTAATETNTAKPDHPEGEHPKGDPEHAPDAEAGDYLKVEASHAEKKPEDPVAVYFNGLTVVEAKFDPENLEGGTAKIEIDLASIDSGVPKRDGHLKSTDYFDVENHPKGTISVSEVKAKGEDTYSAQAEVTVHGVSQTWPVEFKVVGKEGKAVTIEATHSFERTDFEIGKKEGDSAAPGVTAHLKITLTAS